MFVLTESQYVMESGQFKVKDISSVRLINWFLYTLNSNLIEVQQEAIRSINEEQTASIFENFTVSELLKRTSKVALGDFEGKVEVVIDTVQIDSYGREGHLDHIHVIKVEFLLVSCSFFLHESK